MAAVDNEIVALGLARDSLRNGRMQALVALRDTQGRAQIRRILLSQAHIKGPGAGHPHAVAGFTEIMSERRNEAEPPAGLGDSDIAGGTAGAVVAVVEREPLGQSRANNRKRK